MTKSKNISVQSSSGEIFTLGETVWSRQLSWAETQGTSIRERYGVSHGYEGCPIKLIIRRARRVWHCRDCGRRIVEGELHGSTYAHYCLDGVTHQQPPRQFKATWDAEPIVEV